MSGDAAETIEGDLVQTVEGKSAIVSNDALEQYVHKTMEQLISGDIFVLLVGRKC